MDNRENLLCYQNVESVQFNLPDDEFEKYCELKLQSAEDDIDFIREYIYQGKAMNVCEIGCGNGKLLLSMERENMISHAVGYEVSEARCKFADKFLRKYGSKQVQIINDDFLNDCESVYGEYDLIILVDIVWLFISSLYDKAEHDAMQWIYKNLRKGGMVLFELEDYSKQIEHIKKEGVYQFWEEFPKEDPYKYGLYKLDLDDDGNVVDEKKFIRRNGGKEETFKNIIKSYTRKESIELLSRYGMGAEIFPYYDNVNSSFGRPNEHDLYRVLARK
ncbi:tRNA (guanine-N(7)-)-methyltransferase [Lachnospiraceae bacterium]|nr:tRNA (guanine-N(7)-)-methyltransferase [Lachnospiraceae bacterium]